MANWFKEFEELKKQKKIEKLNYLQWQAKQNNYNIKSIFKCLRYFSSEEWDKVDKYFTKLGYESKAKLELMVGKIIAEKLEKLEKGENK